LCRRIDVAIEIELDHNLRGADRAQRCQLGDAGNLGELTLKRGGDRGPKTFFKGLLGAVNAALA
jgi:hypothetical protein